MKNIMTLLIPETYRVRARRNIYPNPLESDGRIVKRGECGEIQDEADGFMFVQFADGYIAMADDSEVVRF